MTRESTDRARVPFALVGVVLLLGSVGYANTVALSASTGGTVAAESTLDRTEATARPAIRTATEEAARAAAAEPVTGPADTPAGDALNGSSPFRDALRLRIYGSVASALRTTEVDDGRTVGTAGLPAVNSTSELRDAIRRIDVRPAEDGTATTVTIRNVTIEARRDGRVVATARTDYVVTVAVPVLAMHERTLRYERRLNAGPLEGPGLGRQLTWRLTGVAEARGLAQYGGAPVRNVLTNRHVELSSNAAALREQRAVYGRADAEGRAGVVRATAEVGTTDLFGPAIRQGPAWTDTVLSASGDQSGAAGARSTPSPGSDGDLVVGVNRSADRAFAEFLAGDARRVADAAYRAEVTRTVRLAASDVGEAPEPEPPGRNWTLVADRRSNTVEVVDRTTRRRDDPREFLDATLTVRVRHAAVRTWLNGTRTRETRTTWTDVHEVRVRVSAEYRHPTHGPNRPVSPAFEPGGALGGSNLADVRDDALERLAGPERLRRVARDAPETGDDTETIVVSGDRPEELDDWVYADVAGLRERTRDVTVRVDRDAVAAGEANAPAALAAALRERRAALVDAPSRYDGASDRARVAARAAFLDGLIALLEDRAGTSDRRNDAFRDALEEAEVPLSERLDEVSEATAERVAPEPRPIGHGPAGPVVLTPDATPGYLTLTSVSPERTGASHRVGEVRPLAARNTNVFTVPSGDVADTVTDAVLPKRRTTSLRSAGLALRRANGTLGASGNRTLERRRDDLASEVRPSVRRVRTRADGTLDRRAGDRLSARDRSAALDAADREYPGLGERAVAMTNGSYADAVARETAERGSFSATERDRLAVRLRLSVTEEAGSERIAVPADVTNATVTTERRVGRELVHDAVESGTDRAAEEVRDRYAEGTFGPAVAGLPVAPAPGYWYATVNAWSVEVRGHYPEFAVEARTGSPDGAGTVVRYVRDGRPVRFDVDGDGAPERVGRNERVSFRTSTVVLVAVPAGKGGVGDVDGDADERSDGWPCPDASVPGCEREP
ncbi:DUF7286 family protein [Halorarum salinum]|uniref:Uncharacterized protein n=1 Tax=Halorarum salinum TaxID=2743089 RepID=A0A7D5LBR8_9EURY|nr:hypothetical protein [Halobaculum salinum]QLG62993.1 hypothetical protein HUG12_15135 [Halobaculum salinum]